MCLKKSGPSKGFHFPIKISVTKASITRQSSAKGFHFSLTLHRGSPGLIPFTKTHHHQTIIFTRNSLFRDGGLGERKLISLPLFRIKRRLFWCFLTPLPPRRLLIRPGLTWKGRKQRKNQRGLLIAGRHDNTTQH